MMMIVRMCNWASEASPTLVCSIEISCDIYIYMSVCRFVSDCLWETHTKKLFAKIRGRNYVDQIRACSKSVLVV